MSGAGSSGDLLALKCKPRRAINRKYAMVSLRPVDYGCSGNPTVSAVKLSSRKYFEMGMGCCGRNEAELGQMLGARVDDGKEIARMWRWTSYFQAKRGGWFKCGATSHP